MSGDGDTSYWDAGARADAPARAPGAMERDPATLRAPSRALSNRAPGPPPFARRGRWPGAAVVAGAAVLGAGLAAVVVAVLLRPAPSSSHAPATRAGRATTTTVSPAALTAARSLDNLLVQNEQNRSSVQDAASQIASCGDVTGAATALHERAVFRTGLLAELSDLDLRALPDSGALVSELRAAWQSSAASDESYARWGSDETPKCTPDDYADPNYQAAEGTDGEATTAKRAFAAQWDGIAPAYGLPQWQAGQL